MKSLFSLSFVLFTFIAVLPVTGEQNIDSLIELLGSQDIFQAEKVIDELVSSGDRALDRLIVHIDDPDRNVASRSIESLGRIGNQRTVEPLLKKMSSLSKNKETETFTTRFLRIVTIKALGELKSPEAVPVLKKVMENGNEYDKIHSLVALSKIGDYQAVLGLIVQLKSENKNIRYIAADSLGSLRKVESIDALIEALGDREWFVRDTVAEALGELGVVRAVPNIEELLNDHVPFVRKTAITALKKITGKNYLNQPN